MAENDREKQVQLEAIVGIPKDKMFALIQRIQDQSVRSFSVVEHEFLDVLWTHDYYRSHGVIPAEAKSAKARAADATGGGSYRNKGNFFSDVLASILSNKTTSTLAPRSKVQGFSQKHQIDIAWPSRFDDENTIDDPLICCESKLSGAPGEPGKKDRGGIEDFSNRRKELKFQAADLKLYRNRDEGTIFDWDQWRRSASPRVFTFWAARLTQKERFSKMVSEAQLLTATYTDGMGVFGYTVNVDGTGYVSASAATEVAERVASLDAVLNTVAAEIQTIIRQNNNRVPAPRYPVELLPGADEEA